MWEVGFLIVKGLEGEQLVNDSTILEVHVRAQGEHESSYQVDQTSTALVIQSSEEPPTKKLKFVLEDFPISSPTPLNSIIPPVIISNILYDQYTTNLFSSGSSEYSLTSPPKVVDKGKGKFKAVGEGNITLEDAKAQMEEIKRLADLKAEKAKSKKTLKRVVTAQELKARAAELAAYEAKKVKMLEEYNHCINFRDDPLPITKFNYRVATQAGKLGISPPSELTTVDVHPGEKKAGMKRKRRVEVIHELFFKDNVVVDGMHENLVPHAGVAGSLGLLIRIQNAINVNSQTAHDMYNMIIYVIEAREDVVEARKIIYTEIRLSVEDSLSAKYQRAMKGSLDAKHQRAMRGLAECKASASNLRRIQVKDIVKEVKDYMKTYSSAGMDISWRDVSKNGRAFNVNVLHHRILDTSQLPPLRKQPHDVKYANLRSQAFYNPSNYDVKDVVHHSDRSFRSKQHIMKYVEEIKEIFSSIDDGEITSSAYDTAWVALIQDANGPFGGPLFPSSLQWIVNHQLPDGSWGEPLMFSAYDRLLNTLACIVTLTTWNIYPDKCKKELGLIEGWFESRFQDKGVALRCRADAARNRVLCRRGFQLPCASKKEKREALKGTRSTKP
ncbi:Ent-copalyl diphosphate synthase, chloroplastic-like protein [Tanacetum coccineum]|uniref:Ent-copalyl diphosphate synthase, chloroplastic-like protein n=1 Tax=Tanacetum coccineum TaxID=301880 RepID=A0ABQ5FXG2_9ASTR